MGEMSRREKELEELWQRVRHLEIKLLLQQILSKASAKQEDK